MSLCLPSRLQPHTNQLNQPQDFSHFLQKKVDICITTLVLSPPKAVFPQCFQTCQSFKSGTRGFQFFFSATNCSKLEIGHSYLWWPMDRVHHIFTKVFATNNESSKRYDGLVLWTSALDQLMIGKYSKFIVYPSKWMI